jgi:hypothetical protein
MRKDWRARLKLVEVAVKAVAEAENAAAEYENGCHDEAEVEPVKIGLYRVEGMCSRTKMMKLKWNLSRLVYIGSKACVRERRRPNTANPEDLVRRRYVVGKDDQTSSNVKVQVSNE